MVGLYQPGWVLLGLPGRRARDRVRAAPGAAGSPLLWRRTVAPIALGVAVAAALLVAVHWAMPTQTGLDIGMYLPNTTWHNAPFAARFVQDHQVGALHFTEVLKLTVWFYPQNSELLHSAGHALPRHRLPLAADEHRLDGALPAGGLVLRPPLRRGRHRARSASRWCSTPRCCCSTSPATPRTTRWASSSCSPRRRSWSTPRRSAQPRPDEAHDPARPAADGRIFPTRRPDRRRPRGRAGAGHQAQPARPVRPAHPRRDRGERRDRWRAHRRDLGRSSSLITGGFWFARNLVEAGNPLPWIKAGPLPGPDQVDIDIREPHTVVGLPASAGRRRDQAPPDPRPPRQLRRALAARPASP